MPDAASCRRYIKKRGSYWILLYLRFWTTLTQVINNSPRLMYVLCNPTFGKQRTHTYTRREHYCLLSLCYQNCPDSK